MERKILSIDGGGVKGAFPASFLATIEDTIDAPVTDYFDLIVGTSTGGIIALALGLGFTAKEITTFYEELGPRVFGGNAVQRIYGSLKQLGRSKYSSTVLKQSLDELFGTRLLGESKVRLVVPSFNIERGEVHLFKTRHLSRYDRDHRIPAVDVALATAAAPTFFRAHKLADGIPLVDGGIWANNPTGIAVTEAVGVLSWPADQVRVLSLGCTSEPFDAGKARTKPVGLFQLALKVTSLFMTGQASGSMGVAANLIGHDRIHRFDPSAPAGRYGLDKSREIEALVGLGAAEGRKALPSLKTAFFTDKVQPFNPEP